MRTGVKLSSTSLSDWEPLGVAGDPVYRSANQILNLLNKNLAPEIASVLAVPIRDDQRHIIDWYSANTGEVRRLRDLTEIDRDNALEVLRLRLNEIESFSQKLLRQEGEAAKTFGGLLHAAQCFPNEECIFTVDSHPVVVSWGFRLPALIAAPSLPTASSAVTSPAEVSAQTNNQVQANSQAAIAAPSSLAQVESESEQTQTLWQKYGWWVLLLILLIFGILSLFRGCTTDFPLFPGSGDSAPKRSEATSQPDVTEVPLKISPEALKRNDVSVFEGRWYLSSNDVMSTTTGKLIQIEFELTRSGEGRSLIDEKNGNTCSGKAFASIQPPDSFTLQSDPMPCVRGNGYSPLIANCSIDDSRTFAACRIQGKNGPIPARFTRQK